MGVILTSEERQLVQDLGRWYTRVMVLVGDSPVTSQHDRNEILAHVHALQHALMAQAAARAYPKEFRLLGGTIAD